MTSNEQIEYICAEAKKLGIDYSEYVKRYGHTLPKPEPTKYKEREWWEDIEHKACKKVERICQNPECGAPFLASRNNAKYCPVCKKERQRKLSAENNRRRRKEAKEK